MFHRLNDKGDNSLTPMDTCIRTRKIIKCSILIDSYLHYDYVHAKDYFTKRQSILPFRGIYVVWIETFICINHLLKQALPQGLVTILFIPRLTTGFYFTSFLQGFI
jgi:hypothetical protein